MRLHISLDDDLVAELDRRVGRRQRSAFISQAVRRVLAEQRSWEAFESALGQLSDSGHEWDDDPGAWVRAQRVADSRRVG
jgi:Arc/MetJ family transcription regulator